MGLPRSSLVKSKSSEVAPAPAPVPIFAPAAAANPFAAAPAGPSVFAAPTAAVPAQDDAASREPFRTKADSIEVDMASQRTPELAVQAAPSFAPPSFAPPSPPPFGDDVMRAPYGSGPSSSELLERAAALGPARMTWESIVLPHDPVLNEKLQPHVAERRARLTRVVKIALGACVGLCVLALGVSAVSGDSSSSAAAAAPAVGKTVASKGIVPVEPLDSAKHAKAVRRTAPAVTTAAIVRGPKRR